MKEVERRLKELEQATQVEDDGIQLIFYDIEQGINPEDIHPRARVVVWMPKNGREHEG